jgi:hypothetical protein
MKTTTRLEQIVQLYGQLDSLRANKYVNPEELERLAESTNLKQQIIEAFPDWHRLIERLKSTFSNRYTLLALLNRLQSLEPFMLVLYLVVTITALMKKSPSFWNIQMVITAIVFSYLVLMRVSIYFLATNPTKKILQQYDIYTPGFNGRLRNGIISLISILDQELLNLEQSSNEYKTELFYTDYPGLYYRGKPSKAGPKRLLTIPFPLYPVITNSVDTVQISMGRMDEKLIKSLESIPQATGIELLTRSDIVQQATFRIYFSFLQKNHKKAKLEIAESNDELKGIQLITRDSTWQFDLSANWQNTRYVQVKDNLEKQAIQENFDRLWKSGKKTTIQIDQKKKQRSQPL